MPVPVTIGVQSSLASSLFVSENINAHSMSQHNVMQAHEREERHRRTAEALSKVLYCLLCQSTILCRYNRCMKNPVREQSQHLVTT